MSSAHFIRDVHGVIREIGQDELLRYLSNNVVTLFGMDVPTISALRNEYLMRSGPVPATPETVKAVFADSRFDDPSEVEH